MLKHSYLIAVSAIVASLAGCGSSSTPDTKPAVAQPMAVAATPKPVMKPKPVLAPVSKPSEMTLRFLPASIAAITAGTKTSTCRKGARTFPGNVAVASDGKRNVQLVIVGAVQKRMSQLTDADAKADGSASLEAMTETLEKSYPGIGADDVVTVVKFRVQ